MDDETGGRQTEASFYAPKLKELALHVGLWHPACEEYAPFDMKLVPVPADWLLQHRLLSTFSGSPHSGRAETKENDRFCITNRAPWVYEKAVARFYISERNKLNHQNQLVVTDKDKVFVTAYGRPITNVTSLFSFSGGL